MLALNMTNTHKDQQLVSILLSQARIPISGGFNMIAVVIAPSVAELDQAPRQVIGRLLVFPVWNPLK